MQIVSSRISVLKVHARGFLCSTENANEKKVSAVYNVGAHLEAVELCSYVFRFKVVIYKLMT